MRSGWAWGMGALLAACGGTGTADDPAVDTDSATPPATDTDTTTDTPVSACAITPDGAWSAPAFEDHAAEALALRAALDAFSAEMRAAEQDGIPTQNVDAWRAALEAGSPSAGSAVSVAWRPVLDAALVVFAEADAAGATAVVDGGVWVMPSAGGVSGTEARLLSAGGIEPRQIFDKGLVAGGGLYAWALAQTADGIDDADFDAIAAAFGVDAAFDPEGTRTDASNYTYAMGQYGAVRDGLARARAFHGSAECEAERDAALRSAFEAWEFGMVLRGYFYADLARDLLAASSDEDTVVASLHELSEGIAMIAGFRGAGGPGAGPFADGVRRLNDPAIDAILDAMGVELTDLQGSSTAEILLDPTRRDAMVTAVEAALADGYGLTPAQIQAFLAPTPG
jgi:hypothetical protein